MGSALGSRQAFRDVGVADDRSAPVSPDHQASGVDAHVEGRHPPAAAWTKTQVGDQPPCPLRVVRRHRAEMARVPLADQDARRLPAHVTPLDPLMIALNITARQS